MEVTKARAILNKIDEAKSKMVYLSLPGWDTGDIDDMLLQLDLEYEDSSVFPNSLGIAPSFVDEVIEYVVKVDSGLKASDIKVSKTKPSGKEIKIPKMVSDAATRLGVTWDTTKLSNWVSASPITVRDLKSTTQLLTRTTDFLVVDKASLKLDINKFVSELSKLPGVVASRTKR